MTDSPADSSSDAEESFTFGSFTVEDTKEFKRNYNGLPTSNIKKHVSAQRGVSQKEGGSRAVAAAAAEGDIEDRVDRLHIIPPHAAAAPVAAAACNTEEKSPRRAQSPPPALPIPPPTNDDLAQVPAAAPAPAPASAGATSPPNVATVPATVAQAPLPPASEDKRPPPRPMSWAAIAAGPAKPAVAPPAGGGSRPANPPSVAVTDRSATSAAAAGAALANGIANAGPARIRAQPTDPAGGARITPAGGGVDGKGVESAAAGGGVAAVSSPAAVVASSSTGGVAGEAQNGTSSSSGSGTGSGGGNDGMAYIAPSSSVSDTGEGKKANTVAPSMASTAAAAVGVQDGGETADEVGKVRQEEEAAAKAKKDAEAAAAAEALAAAEAEALAEKKWQSLLVLLGREDAALSAAAAGLGGQAGLELVHRGLVNTGNSCFRSVVLQALLACDPFTRVLFRAAPGLKDLAPAQTALPTWAQLARFASAFEPPKPGAMAPLAPGGSGRGSAASGGAGGWSAPVGRARGRHHAMPGASAPVLPDEAMSRAFGAFRTANTGEQEDAQEFLAFFLDQLHEEIVKVKKEEAKKKSGLSSGSTSLGGAGEAASPQTGVNAAGNEDSWLEVGKGRTKAVVNAPDPQKRIADSSVVTGLFYGMFRSEVRKGGSSKTSVTLEPFHCLQLDLDPPTSQNGGASSNNNDDELYPNASNSNNHNNNNNANGGTRGAGGVAGAWGSGGGGGGGGSWGPAAGAGREGTGAGAWGSPGVGAAVTSLDEALAALFGGEAVAGVKGRQNLEVKASRTLTLEQAPKVLTLHLKQFSFHPEFGPRKLARRVRYPLELTIPTRIMSPSLQHQASIKGPLKYRLFTVVLHHGRSLHGGHYTALVRNARGEWRHFDDQLVSPETEGHALNPMSGHPYLLLYTRL